MSTEDASPASTDDHIRRPRGWWHRPDASMLAAVCSALVATTIVLSGVRGAGHRLVRDFVAVPSPAAPESLLPTTASALRAWPLDAVSWAASAVVPTAVQQVLLLALVLALAGVGTGLLLAPAGAAASAAASWVAIWNPYVVERLLLGQPPTLFGYACLPWIVLVGRSRHPAPRRLALLVVVAAPAAMTPWGGVVALVAAVVVELSRADRRPARVGLVAGVGLAWCLPWLLPTLLVGGVSADPDGAAAFALADDSGLGTWASALMGGGVWATGAQPSSRTHPVALTASFLLVGLALAGVVVMATGAQTFGGARRPTVLAMVASALLIGPATLAWWASGSGLDAVTALQHVPGMALVRDQHRMLAPAVLVQAVLVGLVVGWVARHGGKAASALACVLVVALGVASVPDLPRAVRAAYRPVSYPAEWSKVIAVLGEATDPPTVLSLPWQPLRRPRWAGEPAFLDPLPRAVQGDVLVSTSLTVRRGDSLVVVDDSPVNEAWGLGEVSAESLRRHGVTQIVEWLGTPGALASGHDGWRLLHSGPDFRVWDVTRAR